jgi:hypothetical protein
MANRSLKSVSPRELLEVERERVDALHSIASATRAQARAERERAVLAFAGLGLLCATWLTIELMRE